MAKFVDTNEPFEWMDYFGVNHPHLQGNYLCNICYIPFRFPSEIRVLSVSQPKIICFCRVVCREPCIFVPFFNCRSRPSPFTDEAGYGRCCFRGNPMRKCSGWLVILLSVVIVANA